MPGSAETPVNKTRREGGVCTLVGGRAGGNESRESLEQGEEEGRGVVETGPMWCMDQLPPRPAEAESAMEVNGEATFAPQQCGNRGRAWGQRRKRQPQQSSQPIPWGSPELDSPSESSGIRASG